MNLNDTINTLEMRREISMGEITDPNEINQKIVHVQEL